MPLIFKTPCIASRPRSVIFKVVLTGTNDLTRLVKDVIAQKNITRNDQGSGKCSK